MPLKLYNSMTRKKEVFEPLSTDIIKIYTCGQTVYDKAHIGHMRTYSFWDILKRYLQYRFPAARILHVQNYTDVGHLTDDADQGEDKIVKRAIMNRKDPMELVDTYIRLFEDDLRRLRVSMPDIAPRATGHIIEMISLVQRLLERGFAYETPKGIYFDVSRFPDYGKLAGFRPEEQMAGARIDIDSYKRSPNDFALFIRASPEHLMQWLTPWGWSGYPGWHIECSAMSMKYLGRTFDIHGGGIDHLSLHHPNEQAQSEAVTGVPLATFWLHANHLTLEGERMAKSTGHYISAKDAIDEYGADRLRFFLVTASHYRSQDDFTREKFKQKSDEFMSILTPMASAQMLGPDSNGIANEPQFSENAKGLRDEFIEAMDDDLNTPLAAKILLKYIGWLNSLLIRYARENDKEVLSTFRKDHSLFVEIAKTLAIEPRNREAIDEAIDALLKLRALSRQQKNFSQADEIREKVTKLGFRIEDKPWGTIVVRMK